MTHWALGTGHTFCGLEIAAIKTIGVRCTYWYHRYDTLVFYSEAWNFKAPWEAITCDGCKAEFVRRQLEHSA